LRSDPPALVAPLCPPGFVVELGEVADLPAVVDDEKAADLLVGAIRRLHRGFQDQPDVLDRDRIGPELPYRALGEHDFADRHDETIRAHREYLLEIRG